MLLKNDKFFFELFKSHNCICIEAPDIWLHISKCENNTIHYYTINYDTTEYLYFIDENMFRDMYENNKKIYYMSTFNEISYEIYFYMFGITKQIKHNQIEQLKYVINGYKSACHDDIIKTFDCFTCDALKHHIKYDIHNIFSHNNTLIIYSCGNIFVYNLKFEKITEHLIIEKYIYKMFSNIYYIQKINEHQYFMIIHLEHNYSVYNTLLEKYQQNVWTIYSKTLPVNSYQDTFFHFV